MFFGTLTGQQIKDTYDGLLKLEDSTNGITNSLQPIQDGLGNNTGSRIATNYFTAPNVLGMNMNLVPDYMGVGFSTLQNTNNPNTQNRLLYNIFYDNGIYAYSSVTYNLLTLTSTSDVVSMYFYSLQLVPGYGVAPKDLIMSGITLLSTGSTGVKTTALPSNLSFSGTGGGYYIAAFYYANSGVTPTARYSNGQITQRNQGFNETLGYYMNAAGTAMPNGSRIQALIGGSPFIINNLSVQSSYSNSDIQNNLGASLASSQGIGFGLGVVK